MRWLLRLTFRLLYHELAFTYDLVSWFVSMGQWRTWQRQTIPFLTGEKILEVAHGTGNLQLDLIAKGHRPIAFDLSPQMGWIASRKLRTAQVKPPVVRGKVQALPFTTAYFTSLVSTFPTEFIVDTDAVKEFARVLVSGGRIVFVPSAYIIPAHFFDRLAKWLFEVTGQGGSPEVEAWWQSRLAQVYQSAGFQVKVERVNLPRSIVWVVIATKM